MNIKAITNYITGILTKYKRQRVANVVDAYAKAAEAHIVRFAPVAISLYRDVAQTVIDKTYENPEPLLDFIRAANALHAHYGENIVKTVKARMEAVEAAVGSNDFPEMTALITAVADMCTDANDAPATSAQ